MGIRRCSFDLDFPSHGPIGRTGWRKGLRGIFMQPNIKSGITFGAIGGLLTFIFGGWSVAILGILMGVALGFILGNRLERKGPYSTGMQALIPALISGAVLLILSLLQNYVVQNIIGSQPAELNIVIPANLIGVLG